MIAEMRRFPAQELANFYSKISESDATEKLSSGFKIILYTLPKQKPTGAIFHLIDGKI